MGLSSLPASAFGAPAARLEDAEELSHSPTGDDDVKPEAAAQGGKGSVALPATQ